MLRILTLPELAETFTCVRKAVYSIRSTSPSSSETAKRHSHSCVMRRQDAGLAVPRSFTNMTILFIASRHNRDSIVRIGKAFEVRMPCGHQSGQAMQFSPFNKPFKDEIDAACSAACSKALQSQAPIEPNVLALTCPTPQ